MNNPKQPLPPSIKIKDSSAYSQEISLSINLSEHENIDFFISHNIARELAAALLKNCDSTVKKNHSRLPQLPPFIIKKITAKNLQTNLEKIPLKTLVFTIPKNLYASCKWRLSKTLQHLFVDIQTFLHPIANISGIKIRINSSMDYELREALLNGSYESPELKTIKSKLTKNDRVMEIGTCLGCISSYCAKEIGSENVFTFEANPSLEPRIKDTYAMNKVSPTISFCLLSDKEGESEFFVEEKKLWSSSTIQRSESAKPITIPTRPLNEEIRKIDPTFLIIDIEGGEYELFKVIEFHNIKKIAIELHERIIGKEKVESILIKLQKAGFIINENLSSNRGELFLEKNN